MNGSPGKTGITEPSLGSTPIDEKSSRLRLPLTQRMPVVQIPPKWYGVGVIVVCWKVWPSSRVVAT